MKVLITGSQGQLGKELQKKIPNDIEVIPTDRKTFNLLNLKTSNLMEPGQVQVKTHLQ